MCFFINNIIAIFADIAKKYFSQNKKKMTTQKVDYSFKNRPKTGFFSFKMKYKKVY